MASRAVSRRRELEDLKAELALLKAAARKRQSDEDIAAMIRARCEELQRQRQEYEAMTVEQRIGHNEKALAELPPDAWLADYQRRCLELTILELRGASPELLQVARDEANEAVRRQRPMPRIITHDEAVALLEAAKAHVVGPTRGPTLRHRRADVIDLEDYRPRDVLGEYRGRPQPRLEPEAT